MQTRTDDLRVKGYTRLISPKEMIETIPVSEAAARTVVAARGTIEDIVFKKDRRILLVAEPCSMHDECISWKTTEALVMWAAEKLAAII